jgi:hypothetical protein
MKRLGTGVFRTSYLLAGCDLIIKFPLPDDPACNKAHTRTEVKKIRRFNRFAVMRPYMPRVHYFDSRAGVVVMTYYPTVAHERGLARVVTRLVKHLTGITLSDITGDNVRKDAHGTTKFVDLAYERYPNASWVTNS